MDESLGLCCSALFESLEEEGPRLTTKELRDHFERTIEEAAPSKPMKVIGHACLKPILLKWTETA